MPWSAVATAVVGSVASNVVGGMLGGGGGGGSAAQSAADPFGSQRGQYQTQLNQMMQPGGFTPQDPSYKWRFDQGQQALERSMAMKGQLGSGNMGIALQEYGQGMASQEYQNQFSRLSGLAGATSGSPGQAGVIAQQNQQDMTAFGSQIGKATMNSWDKWNSKPTATPDATTGAMASMFW